MLSILVSAACLCSNSNLHGTWKSLLLLAHASSKTADTDDEAAAIRKLVSSASAMSRKDFVKMVSSVSTPKASDFDDKSLTLMLFSLPSNFGDDKQRDQQFSYLTDDGFPKPAALAAETDRERRIGSATLPLGPVTMIHSDRVTGCTARVDGDRATGTGSFNVPSPYKGKVEHRVQRGEGKWRNAQFTMSKDGIDIVRRENGTWREH